MELCYPVNYINITNGYSTSHKAIDLGWRNNPNVPILSCFNGTISRIYTDEEFGGGLTLSIKYDNGFSSDFKHLSKILVSVGNRVKQMQQVAIMGDSGWNTTGPHLHFNLYKNGVRVDPLDYCYVYPNQEVAEKDKSKVKYYESRGDEMKFKIGDQVIINGDLYSSANSTAPSGKVQNKVTKITRVVDGALHPYNTTGDLGWMNEIDIRFYEEDNNFQELYEIELAKNETLQKQLDLANGKIQQAIDILQ